ncbi:MAG: hypothetical protein J2P51_08755 [Hyphomicrobiaceae bacterium]|nr:hypothetical protein [Hyphomicrobiaceae bacterium]
MSLQAERVLNWIDRGRAELADFLVRFVRSARPNLPGDTRSATAALRAWSVPRPEMPNVVVFEGSRPGRHLMPNGQVDVCIPSGTDTRLSRQRSVTTLAHLAMPDEHSDVGVVKTRALSARD